MTTRPRRLAITGAHGFLGWHLSCRLLAQGGVDVLRLGRTEFDNPDVLAASLADVDTLIHLADVNRADCADDVAQGKFDLATRVATALGDRPVHIVYANSVQADSDNPYGRGKSRAAKILSALPGTVAEVLLPNLFGEHARPHYDSFVATFVDEVANGRQPTVTGHRCIPLLHAQDAAQVLIDASSLRVDQTVRPTGEERVINDVLALLNEFHGLYAERGELPDLSTRFRRDLFNTYRSALFPSGYPIHPQVHADPRGELVESVRAHGGTGQTFVSSTVPGALRGDHWHLHKVERFMVVRGEAEIALRRLFSEEIVRFRVSGERPGFVDMPTMWVHNIRNVGDADLVTVFWADELLDPENPDQYPMKVEED